MTDASVKMHECRECQKETIMLHQVPGGGLERLICGGCVGKANRKLTDALQRAIVTLKHSTDDAINRECIQTLGRGIGEEAAQVAGRVIRAGREAGKYAERAEKKSYSRARPGGRSSFQGGD